MKSRAQALGGDGCKYYSLQNRQTKTTTAVFDVRHLGAGLWYRTECMTHKKGTGADLLADAIWLAGRPLEFCKLCQQAQEG